MRLFAFRSRKNERHPVPSPSRRQLAALNGHARASEEEDDVVGGQQGWLTADLVQKSYRGRMVVKGVSLATARGEAVGLLGPNGAGKTTVFYMITGLVPADSGASRWTGAMSPGCRCIAEPASASVICRRKPQFSVA